LCHVSGDLFELEEFGESPAIDRARELEKELGKKK
jgi:hypothetical protein